MNTAATEPNSRQKQRDQTRGQILSAAAKVFARSGFDASSLADIAAQAGVKKALVQYHFSTKEQLWKEAATYLWQGRNARLEQLIGDNCDNDLGERMRRGFTALVEYTRENPEWLWFMFHEAAAKGPRLHWLTDHHLREDYRLGEKFITLFQQRGLIREGSPLHLLHLISGALTYNLLVAPQTQLVTGTDLASEESIARQVELLQSLLAPQGD
ncbi:MAG: TetR family transcriptional regulator [Haliea sp.]|jgi:AcrR family transcriptional regulator|nr:TetR family transcriptional regulator [Haliea sp.]